MPTGYTYPIIEKNIGFREFALECAKAFCIESRDTNELPTEIKASTWSGEQLQEYVKEFEDIKLMTDRECQKAALEDRARRILSIKESRASTKAADDKILAMIESVKKFKPPTKNHLKYKEFMLEQLTTSLSGGMTEERYNLEEKQLENPPSGKKWRAEKMKSIKWHIRYHKKEQKKDDRNAKIGNRWLKQLRDAVDRTEMKIAEEPIHGL